MSTHLVYLGAMKTIKPNKSSQRVHRHAYERLSKIVNELQRHRFPTRADLAELIERDPRTVQRDICALKNEWDAPIQFDRTRNGFYLTDSSWRMPELRMTEGELISFFVAERILRRLSDTTEVRIARSALRKLADYLPDEVVIDVEALENAISHAAEPALEAKSEILRQLTAAAAKRQTLHIHYYSQHQNANTERDVNVLLIHDYLGEWYAVCQDLSDNKKIKDFHAGRIKQIAQTGRTFDPPEDWPEDKEKYLRRGFGMFRGGKEIVVEVEFDADQARYARERKYHPTQKNHELPEGRLRITFETTEAALDQVARWLMQYGEHAVALRPAELREMMQERLQKTLRLYEP